MPFGNQETKETLFHTKVFNYKSYHYRETWS